MKTEILYGLHPIIEALKADRRTFFRIYLGDNRNPKRLESVIAHAQSRAIPIKRLQRAQMEDLTGTPHHQGIGAEVSPYPLLSLEHVLAGIASKNKGLFLLLLDNITDPHNLGALARTALSVGIHALIITKHRSVYPSPAVSKVSAGAIEHLPIIQVTNLVNTQKALKNLGVWIVGLAHDAHRSLFDSDLTGPLALIIGGEGRGLRLLVKKNCDYLISIPQIGAVTSLNASVAGAVTMYEALRQRR